jgi:uncharacterized membrane protein YeaQ/YmgE (transglycosylase-associated protein family)
MTGIGWFAAIFVGGLAGWLAERYMERDHGLLKNITLGIAGAIVFNFILSTLLGSTLGGVFGQLFSGFVGACLLIWVGKLIRERNG